jgi:hypothetical protein
MAVLAVLLAFQLVAVGKNSGGRGLKTGRSANDVKAVAALCRRCGRILFFHDPRARGLVFRDKSRM